MKVVAVIQARMGSTRLPGKVLKAIGGEPMLARVVERTRRAASIDDVVIVTSTRPTDLAIVALCEARGWACLQGSEEDVLDRYYQAARASTAGAVVRITADCPLIDPEVIDEVVGAFIERQPQTAYASNLFPRRTFPRGLDAEVLRFDALERVWQEARGHDEREHVTPYMHRHPERFAMHNVTREPDDSAMRWVVDTEADLGFVCAVYERLGNREDVTWREVLRCLEQEPALLRLNQHVQQHALERAS